MTIARLHELQAQHGVPAEAERGRADGRADDHLLTSLRPVSAPTPRRSAPLPIRRRADSLPPDENHLHSDTLVLRARSGSMNGRDIQAGVRMVAELHPDTAALPLQAMSDAIYAVSPSSRANAFDCLLQAAARHGNDAAPLQSVLRQIGTLPEAERPGAFHDGLLAVRQRPVDERADLLVTLAGQIAFLQRGDATGPQAYVIAAHGVLNEAATLEPVAQGGVYTALAEQIEIIAQDFGPLRDVVARRADPSLTAVLTRLDAQIASMSNGTLDATTLLDQSRAHWASSGA